MSNYTMWDRAVDGLEIIRGRTTVLVVDGHDRWLCLRPEWDRVREDFDATPAGGVTHAEAYSALCASIAGPLASTVGTSRDPEIVLSLAVQDTTDHGYDLLSYDSPHSLAQFGTRIRHDDVVRDARMMASEDWALAADRRWDDALEGELVSDAREDNHHRVITRYGAYTWDVWETAYRTELRRLAVAAMSGTQAGQP